MKPCFYFSWLAVLAVLATGQAARAQTTTVGWVLGLAPTTYQFDAPTVYPGTSTGLGWLGAYTKNNLLLGADVTRTLAGNWQLKSGLRLSTSGYTQEVYMGTIELYDGTIIESYNTLTINHVYLDLPVLARYQLWQKKWSPYAEAGISTHYYLSTLVSDLGWHVVERRFEHNLTSRPLFLRANLALGCQLRVGERRYWFAQLTGYWQLLRAEEYVRNPVPNLGAEIGWRCGIE
ncbi:MAG: PorT family protein [Saprospiraceae bacterium]|nr:PorT family protein [Saprospiraceae bacterium]